MRQHRRSLGGRSRRIDARSQNDPAVKAGIRGIHRDTDGTVIGGYGAEGNPLGTKAGARTPSYSGLRRWKQMNSGAKLASEKRGADVGKSSGEIARAGETRAASGDLLAKRKKLYEEMRRAGAGGLGTGLRQRASELGVTQSGWDRAKGSLTAAPSMVARAGAGPVGKSPAPAVAGQGTGLRRRRPINPNARVVGQG